MVEPNSRLLLDIVKDENSHVTTKFKYENMKTSFNGFYTRNRDIFFVVLFLAFVILLHIYRASIVAAYHYLRNKRYRVKNDISSVLKCKKCKVCSPSQRHDPSGSPARKQTPQSPHIKLRNSDERFLRELETRLIAARPISQMVTIS